MALSRAFASAACDSTPDEASRRLGMSEGAATGEAEANGARGGTRTLTILRELPHGCPTGVAHGTVARDDRGKCVKGIELLAVLRLPLDSPGLLGVAQDIRLGP